MTKFGLFLIQVILVFIMAIALGSVAPGMTATAAIGFSIVCALFIVSGAYLAFCFEEGKR